MASRSLQLNPKLDAWVRLDEDGRVTIFTGKAEIGQGITTALAMIAAEELDVALKRIDLRTPDTAEGPNEFLTAGSMSIEQSGGAIRQATAEARRRLLEQASEKLGRPASELVVEDGRIAAAGSEAVISYWELMGGRRFEGEVGEAAKPKPAALHRLVGRAAPGLGMQALVTRGGEFVHDLERPGMLHARVVRPPRYEAQLGEVDEASVRAMPGVAAVLRDGRFLGVVTEREEQAVAAAEALASSAEWQGGGLAFGEDELVARLVANPRRSLPVIDGAAQEGEISAVAVPASAETTHSARYFRPYHAHASIAPSAALAEWQDDALTVWCHSQGVQMLRPSLAGALGVDVESVRVVHVPGPGCYGHNGADDAALDAALLARTVPGRPVLLQWQREDEHSWEPYGPAMLIDLEASLDADGCVVDWNHDVYSDTHSGRPFPMEGHSGLLAAWHRDPPMTPPPKRPGLGFHSGMHRNADPFYTFPQRRITKHMVEGMPLRVSSLRGLGAFANVFAIESFMDELAHAAGVDPVTFRLRHLADERARSVIEAAVDAAGGLRLRTPGRGRGLGFSRYENHKSYAAVVAELSVDDVGGIRLERFTIAGDAGEIVDPDGLRNQLEGGAIQAASWTLKERVRFDRDGIRSRDWDGYPILSFPEVPEVETVLLDQPGAPSLGAGEAAQGPTPAAIANAVFAAVGARLREIPFTPERVQAARPARPA